MLQKWINVFASSRKGSRFCFSGRKERRVVIGMSSLRLVIIGRGGRGSVVVGMKANVAELFFFLTFLNVVFLFSDGSRF